MDETQMLGACRPWVLPFCFGASRQLGMKKKFLAQEMTIIKTNFHHWPFINDN
jgi:hypothetical protein